MRTRSVPDPVDDELPRPDLLRRLQGRFRAPVVSVVAGAGFGKSTAMAQAVRHNHVQPIGIDVWVTCRAGLEDAEQLGAAILEQLGPADTRSSDAPTFPTTAALAAAVERAITNASPLDLCLVLDDVHELPPGSSAERLLVEILRRLPENGHLVLVSRRPPTLPLARLRAADRLIELGEADLAFSASEVRALATAAGRSADSVSGLGGWPALVRLGLVAPRGADREYLVEEVLASLGDEQRVALLALALVGPADDATVARVAAQHHPVTPLLRGVPLVSRSADGRLDAHQLWDDALQASFPADVLHEVRRRAIDVLLELDQPARAAPVALAARDHESLDRIALAMVRRHLNHIPIDTVRPWLDRDIPRGPALRTLEALVRYTVDVRDPSVDELLDEVLAETTLHPDTDVEAVVLAAATVVAHARQDLGRLFGLALRAEERRVRGEPVLDLLRAGLAAVSCDLRGDPEGAIEALQQVEWSRVAVGGAQLAGRLFLQALWMAGRAAESVPFADAWYRGDDTFLGGLPAIARWFAGEPHEAFADGIGVTPDDQTNDRDRFVGSCFGTVIYAARGDRAAVEAIWAGNVVTGLAFDNARDSAHLTYATAARQVLLGDEDAAARAFVDHLAAHPVVDALGERHLRRFPALGHVLSPDLRAHWDAVALGPDHVAARESARALLAVRDGLLPAALPAAPAIVTHLPLPWTIELLAGMAALGDPRAHPLWEEISLVVGRNAVDELERRAAPGPRHLPGAATLAATVPTTPSSTTELSVLGPMEVRHAGRTVAAAEASRLRVRQLLQLLVLERSVTRDRVQGLLWPDLEVDAAAKNLRVTLSHLRKVVEPDRAPGAPGFHLRVDQRTITLHRSEQLWVDAWAADDCHRRLDRQGDVATERAHLTELVALWRGVPFPDLDGIADLAGTLEHLRQRHVDALLRLGELHISAGTATEARRLAREVLAVDPYCEQAHRLAIAADLRLDDVAATRRSVARLSAAMEELGVEVTPATRVLLHRVSMQRDEQRLR